MATRYTIETGDTLPSIAEKLGYSGQWQALAEANLALVPDPDLSDEAKVAVMAERMTVGVNLLLPNAWTPTPGEPEIKSEASKAREAAEEFEERSSRKR